MEQEKNLGEITITIKADTEEFEKSMERCKKLLEETLKQRDRLLMG